jgi:hypothetical protein
VGVISLSSSPALADCNLDPRKNDLMSLKRHISESMGTYFEGQYNDYDDGIEE